MHNFTCCTSSYSGNGVVKLRAADIRPRARYRLQWDQLVVGNRVMVNYNSDFPKERGFWYDAVITRKVDRHRELYAKLVLGYACVLHVCMLPELVEEQVPFRGP